jgi:hypothetical protein
MRNIENIKGGVERVPRLATEREVPLVLRILRGNSRERREHNTEELEVT